MTERRLVEEALRAGVMGERLRAALGAGAGEACHVLDAKYEPGLRCTVLYRLGRRLVRGDLDVTDAGGDGGDAPGRPVVVPGVRLSVFPDDPDLPSLTAITDLDGIGGPLRDAIPGDAGLGPTVRLLRYRPAKRATLALVPRCRADRTAPRRYVVKAYHNPAKAAAVASEAALLAATAAGDGRPLFAPLVAHVPELSLVVHARLPGRGLDELLDPRVARPGPEASTGVRRAALALAALHRQPVVSRRHRPIDAELVRFGHRAARVAAVEPDAGARLADLAARLTEVAATLPPAGSGLVHGDCKPSQFLLHDGGVAVLDLDHCGQADPAVDVGTFLASLRQRAVVDVHAGRISPASAREWARLLGERFRAAYLDAVGSDADLRARIRWYEAVALERKALRAFARSPRSPMPAALVRQAHACLDTHDQDSHWRGDR